MVPVQFRGCCSILRGEYEDRNYNINIYINRLDYGFYKRVFDWKIQEKEVILMGLFSKKKKEEKKNKPKIDPEALKKLQKQYKNRKLKEKVEKTGKLSKKEKLDIVRQIIIDNPNTRKYGYNKAAIAMIREKFKVEITDDAMSRLISEVKEEFQKEQDIREGKGKVIAMFQNLYEKAERINDKRLILVEIAKLDKLYEEQIKLTGSISNMTKEEIDKMKDEALELLKKEKK